MTLWMWILSVLVLVPICFSALFVIFLFIGSRILDRYDHGAYADPEPHRPVWR